MDDFESPKSRRNYNDIERQQLLNPLSYINTFTKSKKERASSTIHK